MLKKQLFGLYIIILIDLIIDNTTLVKLQKYLFHVYTDTLILLFFYPEYKITH